MTTTRGPRLSREVTFNPDAYAGVQQIMASIHAAGAPAKTLELVHMRASQIKTTPSARHRGSPTR